MPGTRTRKVQRFCHDFLPRVHIFQPLDGLKLEIGTEAFYYQFTSILHVFPDCDLILAPNLVL